MSSLAKKVLQGDRLSLSRLISHIENNLPDHQNDLDQLFPHTGNAHIIGVTGPSGAGKSTLVNRLAQTLSSNKGKTQPPKIGIIAVDPTSPFSGGALLGDRVRMNSLTNCPNIFIRSMASRGALGGIAHAVDSSALAMDAAGFEIIIIETVGAGQSEVEIARLAHSTIVVEAPGLGDEIQAAKAGILEIADILIVNKSDKDGSDRTTRAFQSMLALGKELRPLPDGNAQLDWDVPVIQVSALNGDCISELVQAVYDHQIFLKSSGEWNIRSKARIKELIERLVKESLYKTWNNSENQEKMEKMLELAAEKKNSPYYLVKKILK